MVSRLATPGPGAPQLTPGCESVTARPTSFFTRPGGSSSLMAWLGPVLDLLIFLVGSSNPMIRAPTAGSLVLGTWNVLP